jgi:NAD(P)-dependent dehydrogenase (short-subunit alcohol dehydrogenase family)
MNDRRVAVCRRRLDALRALRANFAAALGERGIRVNAIAPGVVETDMSNFARTDAGREFTLGLQRSSAWRNRSIAQARCCSSLPTRRAA